MDTLEKQPTDMYIEYFPMYSLSFKLIIVCGQICVWKQNLSFGFLRKAIFKLACSATETS